MKRPTPTSLVAAGLVLVLMAGSAAARIWYVPDEVATIAAALDSATTGDIVELACGTYYEHDLNLKGHVVLRSEDGVAGCATIDAQQQGRVMMAEDLELPAMLLGLTITGGVAPVDDHYGGGIYCQDASLNMAQCEVRGNYAQWYGGGLYAQRGTLLISSTVFAENEGVDGGGGAARLDEVDGEFLECRFEDNAAIDGAGLFISQSPLQLSFCTFLNNEGWFFGGAIFCVQDCEPVIDHCTLVGNTAYLGGGIMVAAHSYPTIDDCIIAFNHEGSGIYVDDVGSTVDVTCSDVHDNEDGGYTGHIDDQTGLAGNIDVNPYFCDLESGDLTLASASPCLPENNDCFALMGAHGEGCVLTPAPELTPSAWHLERNRPNPFNPATTISFTLDETRDVELAVHDLAGRRIAVLHRGRLAAGRHEMIWRGQDDAGRPQPSGVYLYRLRADRRVESRTMALVR